MHTKIRPRIEKFWCPKASAKPQTHCTQGKKHWNIVWISIHLSSCFREFPHNRSNSVCCIWQCTQKKCEIHVSYIFSGRLILCVHEEVMLLCKMLVCRKGVSVCKKKGERLSIQLQLCLWTSPLKVQFVYNLAVNDLSFCAGNVSFLVAVCCKPVYVCECSYVAVKGHCTFGRLVDRSLLDPKVM